MINKNFESIRNHGTTLKKREPDKYSEAGQDLSSQILANSLIANQATVRHNTLCDTDDCIKLIIKKMTVSWDETICGFVDTYTASHTKEQ